MNKNFTYRVYVPSLRRYHRYMVFDNKTHLTAAKYIQNNDNEQVLKLYRDIIVDLCDDGIDYDTLTCVDKFVILLNVRIMSVSDQFRFETTVGTETEKVKKDVSIDLYDILDEVTNHPLNDDQTLTSPDGYKLTLTKPKEFHTRDVDELMLNVLKAITIDDKTHNLQDLTNKQKQNVLDNLPGDALHNVINYIKSVDTKYRVKVFKTEWSIPEDLERLELKMFDNSFYELIKMLYNCNLEEQYYIRYAMTKHLNFTLDQIEGMTPIDSKTYIKLYQKELDDQRKAREKNNPKEQSTGSLPIPGQL